MKLNTGMLWLALLPLGASGQHIINSEWIDMPFGLYNNSWKGESSESGGILTVTGSGADMTSYTSDGGRVLFKPVHGDCDLTAMVQIPISPDLNYEAEAGLMLRESNDRGLRYMAFVRERADAANAGLVRSLARQAPGINPVAVNQTGYTNQWLKMRVIRNGNTFKTYTSTSAVNEVWMLFTQQSVELGENLNAGIFVCAHTSSTAKLMTNDFQELSASAIVNVQTNAANGVDLTWLTDLPYLPTNTCQYAYSVTRTELDGNQTVVATELLTPIYTDNSITEGLYYKYSISARELPYNPQATTQTVHVGTSGTFRHQASEVNLIAGIAAGLTAAYYDTKDSILPYAVSNITSLAAILNPPGGETTNYKTVVDASLYVDETDTYTFFLELDDGAKLSVDGVKIIENWRDGERWTASAPVKLEKGRAHAFRVEYYQAAGGRIFNLRWNRAGDPNTVVDVPVSSFTPVPAGWMTAGIGNVKLNGNAEFDAINNTISITACGSELTNFVDSGRVALSGFDTTMDLTTTLTSLSSSAASPRAGLTVREEVAFNAVGISLLAVGGGANYSLLALARTDKGGLASATEYTTSIPATDPISLRIVKKTSEYTLYYKSETATSWSELTHSASR